MRTPITPLHVRSGCSLLRGTVLPERLVERARRQGHAALALTDVNGVYGATIFHEAARDAGLQPILGAELLEADHSIVALVESDSGYEGLCRLITRIHRRAEAVKTGLARPTESSPRRKPGVHNGTPQNPSPEGAMGTSRLVTDLAELGSGLQLIVEDPALAAALKRAGLRPWIGIDPATQGHSLLRRLTDCAAALDLPTVATGKALLFEGDDLDVARLLAAVRVGRTYDDIDLTELPSAEACLRGPAQLARQLAGFPQAAANNRRLAERCAAWRLLPRQPVFPGFDTPGGLSAAAYLEHLCREGAGRRYGRVSHTVWARLAQELSIINRLGFAEYFLVVWDIVQYARRREQPVAGRGSGASSLVAYVLGITNVCPLRYDIPFERFLHEGRVDFPDLDVDFCWRIRDDVIDYAFRRWGRTHVAMVCMLNTFQPRSALRETAKAMGFSDDQISRGQFGDEGSDSRNPGIRIPGLARRIIGLPRNLSVHPGGIVIAPRPIDRYVPVQRAAKGVMITQYDKDGVEAIRLVKLDLLGNRNLSTVRATCRLIRRRTGREIDIEKLPPDDPATVATLQAADTVGCNQLESPAMRHLLKMLRPSHAREVMKALALIRPGAASIGMKEVFVRRHRGLDRPPAGCREVDAILRDTYGVMLYEDDVMLAAAAMLGLSPAEADPFRRRIQKCRDDGERLALSREFLGRCAARGLDRDYAKATWVQMAKFNAYSFCRAHAASYAVLSYAGAYLKTHHPLEFWVSALNNNQSMYPHRVYVEEAKRDGIGFLLPDVNRSAEQFSIDDGKIRMGLGCIDGIGPVTVRAIIDGREAGGPFASVADAVARAGLGEAEARPLVLCGALDFTGRARPAMMMELALVEKARTPGRPAGRTLLAAGPTVPDAVADYTDARKYGDERRILGVCVREHLMTHYRRRLGRRVDADSRDIPQRIGRRVRIAGLVEAQRTTPTQNGRTLRFMTMHDEHGLFEVTLMPAAEVKFGGGLDRYGPYIITGRVENQYDSLSVSAQNIALFTENANPCNSC